MSNKAWIIFAAVCICILSGLVLLSRGNQVNVSSAEETKIIAANKDNGNIGDHTYGNVDSKVILIEYGDFQCPACQKAYPNIKTVKEEYKDKIAFIFRNLPLTSIHPNARAAAGVAEAAGLQGKYWEMHDALYENQDAWGNAAADQRLTFFESYAKSVGITDMDKFKADLESSNVSAKINFDMALARKISATSTPTILLGGEKIEPDTWQSVDKLKAKIDEALK